MKRIVIVGATSGIGMEVTKLFLQNNYQDGIINASKSQNNFISCNNFVQISY
jgi:short-subunit dehydrogenase